MKTIPCFTTSNGQMARLREEWRACAASHEINPKRTAIIGALEETRNYSVVISTRSGEIQCRSQNYSLLESCVLIPMHWISHSTAFRSR